MRGITVVTQPTLVARRGDDYEDRVEPVTPAELAAAHSHGEHDALPEGSGVHAGELTSTGGTSH